MPSTVFHCWLQGPVTRRSILKTSRSFSESHSDDYVAWSSLDSSDINEESSFQNIKKTVRFSDVILKKLFRYLNNCV